MGVVKHVLDSDPEWLKLAWKDYGVKEIVGSKDNPVVVAYFKDVGHGWVQDDETAWCAAFVGSCLARAGEPHTGSLAARSYLQWGRSTKSPRRGDVVVFRRGRSRWQGHVGFYLDEDATHVWVLDGNASNQVKVSRRSKSTVLGYRTTVRATNSRTIKAGLAGGGASVLSLVGQGSEALQEVKNGLEMTGLEWAIIIAGFIGVVTAGIVIYARIDDWRKKGK